HKGVGAVTVKYDGFARLPTEPGTYTVTVDIAPGANYTGVTGFVLGVFTIVEPGMPVLQREIVLPSDAVAGLVPSVTTGRAGDSDGGVIITPQADGGQRSKVFIGSF
ncbi:MAG: hypothetical protein LBF85_07400, partial [Tannerella sp.]|nr:hypothetical protein [Tannerella sp.]